MASSGRLGLLSSSGLLIGAVGGYDTSLQHTAVARAMTFAAGVLLAVVAVDLVINSRGAASLQWTVAGLVCGAAVFSSVNALLSRRGAQHRKRCGECVGQPGEDKQPGSGLAIAAGTFLDGVPEGVVLGLERGAHGSSWNSNGSGILPREHPRSFVQQRRNAASRAVRPLCVRSVDRDIPGIFSNTRRRPGVKHHVALSMVGTEPLAESGSGYMSAKVAQERLIKESPIPYSIIHATQFFEFIKGIADAATEGDQVRVAPVLFQPIAADDVAKEVASVAAGPPLNATVEIAGPEVYRFDELIATSLEARNDPREVLPDSEARYFGAILSEGTLIAGEGSRLGETRFSDWLAGSQPQDAKSAATTAA